MNQVNVGVIGAGSISEVHFGGYDKLPHVKLAAVCDLNIERAREKAEKYGVEKVYADYRELIADSEIHAVSICTWNNSHAEIAIATLDAGKHVLVEKPLCKTVAEALQVQEAVKRSGKVLQVGFVRRYAQNAKILKQFIDQQDLGEIYYAKASCLRRLGNPGGWFADVELSGGGPLIDLGVHVIDICWYMMGKPKVVSVSGNTYSKLGNRANIKHLSFYRAADYDEEKNTVEDMANAMIRFETGASLIVDVSFTLHTRNDDLSIKLFGTKGGAELEPELHIVSEKHDTILNIQPQVDHPTFGFEQAFESEVSHFISSVLGETNTLSPVEDGVEMMKILCGIYESATTGKEVVFKSE